LVIKSCLGVRSRLWLLPFITKQDKFKEKGNVTFILVIISGDVSQIWNDG
jgi:hypothetical protein